jgi:hypothetical protein
VIGRVLRVALPVLLLLVVAGGVWFAFTGSRALAAVGDLEDAVTRAQQAVDDTDLAALEAAANDAREAAARADDAVNGPLWAAMAAIPYVGDTPELARTTAGALATAADGLTPLLEVSGVLDPASLYADGRIDVQALRAASSPLTEAATALTTAADQIATAPTAAEGAWVPASLDAQRAQAETELVAAADALTTAAVAADVLPALLGADGPRTWFVGLQTPAEARGTGGLPGNFVTFLADDGRLSLGRTGSNDDFRELPALPDLGPGTDDYVARYGQDPRLFTNSNVSAHFPTAGLLWTTFYQDSFGGQADVAAGLDVKVLGALARATGPITLPDGSLLTPDEVVPFFLSGVYTTYTDRDERKAVQAGVTAEVFAALTSGDVDPAVLVNEFAGLAGEGRVQLWSPDETEERALTSLGLAASVASDSSHHVHPVVINATASKLDAYLQRQIRYEVGRCDQGGEVLSRLSVTLTSDIPADAELADEVVGRAQVGPDGPLSRLQLQTHVAEGSVIDAVRVDGEPVAQSPFVEAGLPSSLVVLELSPRQPTTVTFDIVEAASQDQATVVVQPLARPAEVQVVDVPCAS